MADYDARIVDLYDEDNPDGPDHDFYRALADELGATSIIDLGCGTGLLTVTLAAPGRSVVGVDPSATMLDHARARPGSERVRWLLGDSAAIETGGFDYAVLTGNVAQHILGADWPTTLADLHRALRPGGVLAFESRNPSARAWQAWAEEAPTTRDTRHGQLTEWTEIEGPDADGVIQLLAHNLFTDSVVTESVFTDDVIAHSVSTRSGEHLVEPQALAFRTRERLEDDLAAAGFEIESVWGDWRRTPFSPDDPLLVLTARRLPDPGPDPASHPGPGPARFDRPKLSG